MNKSMFVVALMVTFGISSLARADDAAATAYNKAVTAKDMAATAYQKARAAHAAIAAAEASWKKIADSKASKSDFEKFEKEFSAAKKLIDELKDKDVPKLRADVAALDGRIKEVETKISKIDTCIEAADSAAQVECYKWRQRIYDAIDKVVDKATEVMKEKDTLPNHSADRGASHVREANIWDFKDPGTGLSLKITQGSVRDIVSRSGESIGDALRVVENPGASGSHGGFWYAGWLSGGALAGGLTGLAIGLSRGGNDTIDTTSRPGTLIHKEKGDPYTETLIGAVSGALIGIAVGAAIDAAD